MDWSLYSQFPIRQSSDVTSPFSPLGNRDVSRGNETLCLRATLPASLRALASFLEADVGTTAHAFMLPGLYFTPPVTSHPSIGLITHVIQSMVTLEAFRCSVLFPRGTRVTYITLRRFPGGFPNGHLPLPGQTGQLAPN